MSMSSWGPNVVTTAAAVISGALPLAAAQTDEGGHHQTTYEPTTLLGQPGSLGGESAMPLPCTAASQVYSPLSPPFTSGHVPVPNPAESVIETFPNQWPSSAFNLVPMYQDHSYPFYRQNDASEGLLPEHFQMYPTALPPDGPGQSLNHPEDITSHHHPDQHFAIPEAAFNIFPVSYDFDPPPLMDPLRMPPIDGLPEEPGWTIVGPDQSSDDASLTSSEPSPSAYSSPRAAPDPWLCIPAPTDPPIEVYAEAAAADSPNGSCHSLGNEAKPRKGMRHQPLNAGQREQASNTRRMVACMRCQMQRKTVSSPSPPLVSPEAHAE